MVTIADIEASNPDALIKAGESLASAASKSGDHIGNVQQLMSDLTNDKWHGSASDAANTKAASNVQRHQVFQAGLQAAQTVLKSGGNDLAQSRTSIMNAVDQLKSQGWDVGSDGTVSAKAGGALEHYAKSSPVGSMMIRMKSMMESSDLKTQLALFGAKDQALAAELRVISGAQNTDGDSKSKPGDTDKKDGDGKKKDDGTATPTAGTTPTGNNPAAIAQSLLGQSASGIMSSQAIPMQKGIDNTECCANFVSANLQKAGLINWHSNGVADMASRLKSQGWKVVPASQAKPGDVCIVGGSQHTELVHQNNGGKITLIGSNNTAGGSGPQVVSYDSYTGNQGNVYYLEAP